MLRFNDLLPLLLSAASYHTAVLCQETLDLLVSAPNGLYIDATMGGGGHARALLDRLDAAGRLIGVDQDADAQINAPEDDRCSFLAANFRFLIRWTDYWGITGSVDGILADLGVSSHHFDSGERGFSFRYDAAVPDMRMNSRSDRTARDILLEYSEEELASLFYRYGELHDARQIAALVVAHRAGGYTQLSMLTDALAPVLPKGGPQQRNKLSRIFQALRIEVNDELGALRQLLADAPAILKPGGRLAVISYHSLEDRLVKDFFRLGSFDRQPEGIDPHFADRDKPFKPLTKKAVSPSAEEVANNNRARSAKLRAAVRI